MSNPPNGVQVIVKWAELISDLSRDLINLSLTVLVDALTHLDDLVTLDSGEINSK